MNHYHHWHWQNAYRINMGQESKHYPSHIGYCRIRGIPTSPWVRAYNHIKTAH